MLARQAVLLTPLESSGPLKLPFRQQSVPVIPLFATLTSTPQLAENKSALTPFPAALTAPAPVTPVFATLTQTAGVSLLLFPFWNSPLATLHSPLPPCEASQSLHFFAPITLKSQNPLLCFQHVTHSSAIRWGWGIPPVSPVPTRHPLSLALAAVTLGRLSAAKFFLITLLQTPLRFPKCQPLYFHILPNSLPKTPGWGCGPSFLSQAPGSVASGSDSSPLLALAFSSPMYSICPACDFDFARERQGTRQASSRSVFTSHQSQDTSHRSPDTSHQTHAHERPHRKSPRNPAARLPLALRLHLQPQNYRPAIPLAGAPQRLPRHGVVPAHAHPPRLARRPYPIFLRPPAPARALCRAHRPPRLPHGLHGPDRRSPGRLRQLFPAAADRRARNGLPNAESALFLGHSRLARRHHCCLLPASGPRRDHLARQRRPFLRRLSPHRAQFHRHRPRPAHHRHDLTAPPSHRVGLVPHRHPRRPHFQHFIGCLRPFIVRSRAANALFCPRPGIPPASLLVRGNRRSAYLAAPLLVFRPSRSL